MRGTEFEHLMEAAVFVRPTEGKVIEVTIDGGHHADGSVSISRRSIIKVSHILSIRDYLSGLQ